MMIFSGYLMYLPAKDLCSLSHCKFLPSITKPASFWHYQAVIGTTSNLFYDLWSLSGWLAPSGAVRSHPVR